MSNAINTNQGVRVASFGALLIINNGNLVQFPTFTLDDSITYDSIELKNIDNQNWELIVDGVDTYSAEFPTMPDPLFMSKLGQRSGDFFKGHIGALSLPNLNIPLPHLATGFDSNNNTIALTVSGGVSGGYDENGSDWLIEKGRVNKSDGSIIPNNALGQAAYPIVDGDTFIGGTSFINDSDFLVRLFESGQVDIEHAFFDKSNALIWKDDVRNSIYYDASNTGLWHPSELVQSELYANIQDAYKYQFWSRVVSERFKDIFLYDAPLGLEDAIKAGKYVKDPVVIPYEVTEGNYQVTEGDYLVTP